jgi:hypothetical protein
MAGVQSSPWRAWHHSPAIAGSRSAHISPAQLPRNGDEPPRLRRVPDPRATLPNGCGDSRGAPPRGQAAAPHSARRPVSPRARAPLRGPFRAHPAAQSGALAAAPVFQSIAMAKGPIRRGNGAGGGIRSHRPARTGVDLDGAAPVVRCLAGSGCRGEGAGPAPAPRVRRYATTARNDAAHDPRARSPAASPPTLRSVRAQHRRDPRRADQHRGWPA